MIPCLFCGKSAETSWIIGFPPAPDSQKMGLCALHDTPQNRLQVQSAWQELIYRQIDQRNRIEAFKQGDSLQLLSIYFVGGGSASIPCAFFSLTEHNTLKITTQNGDLIFLPLSQVRSYALSPQDAPVQNTAQTPDTGPEQAWLPVPKPAHALLPATTQSGMKAADEAAPTVYAATSSDPDEADPAKDIRPTAAKI